MNRRLLIYVPTYNRALAIRYFLDSYEKSVCSESCDMIIVDSSDGDETACLVSEYQERLDNLVYKKVIDPGIQDAKVIETLPNVAESYDYVWVCGDGSIPRFDSVMDRISPLIDKDVDIICLDNKDPFGIGDEVFSEAIPFFRYCTWRALAYGATVINTRVLGIYRDVDCVNKYVGTGFCYQFLLLEYLALHDAITIHLHMRSSDSNLGRMFSEWSDNYLSQWSERWIENVEKLPSVYDDYKEEVIRSHDLSIGMFSIKQMCLHHSAMKTSEVRRLRASLERAAVTPYPLILFFSVLPEFLFIWVPVFRKGKRLLYSLNYKKEIRLKRRFDS